MKNKRLAVIVLLFASLMSLFGCGNKHRDDGPGMVNDQPWKAFTLTRSDSYAQYNFWFTVERGDFFHLLTGECRDEDGTIYTVEQGIKLSADDVKYLRELQLGELSDVISDGDDGLILLDAPNVKLTLTWLDGVEQEKALPSDVSIQIYNRFLPYFKK